jgi:hypothetical protein
MIVPAACDVCGDKEMMLYIKCGRRFAVHAEWSGALTARPWLKIQDCMGEKVFDMPYLRVIFTPGGWTPQAGIKKPWRRR